MLNRRQLIHRSAFAAAAMMTPGLFAEELLKTPAMTEGPFYPDHLPLDTDNDLLLINDSTNPSLGEVTHLTGKILTASGQPLRNAFVEIWQCDANGVYLHSRSGGADNRDSHFQGYGRFLTDSTGQYYFRTIKPVPYPGRTPHIHFAVSRNGQRILTTQMLINGHPQNEGDGVFRGVTDPLARETVLVDFKPISNSKIGELSANFDIVLGRTIEEFEDGTIGGGISKPEGNRRPSRG
ncbi:MAG: protocatechuate 3,4-dioxygenase [Planctomycetaceae bacterium]